MRTVIVNYEGYGEKFHWGTIAAIGRGQFVFEYTPEAIKRGLELSPLAQPLRAGLFTELPAHQSYLPAAIYDVLPDSWGKGLLKDLARQQGAAATILGTLEYLGSRGTGALGFEVAAKVDTDNPVPLFMLAQEIQSRQCGQAIELLPQLVAQGGGLGGARPKCEAYLLEDGRFSTRAAPLAQPWLIKFPMKGEHNEVCALEVLYLELARRCRISAPRCRYLELEGIAAVATERFDREGTQKIHTLTLAALLETDFSTQAVDYDDFLRATWAVTKSKVEVKQALRRCIFNVVFNNCDDHSKNVSYRLTRQGNYELAPAYDLTFSEGAHQMAVAGEVNQVKNRDLYRLATPWALGAAQVNELLNSIATVAAGLDDTLCELELERFIRPETITDIKAQIAQNLVNLQV